MESPLHTHLLKRPAPRRILLSSDEEGQVIRPLEVHEGDQRDLDEEFSPEIVHIQQEPRKMDQDSPTLETSPWDKLLDDTHCVFSVRSYADGGSSPLMEIQGKDDDEVEITGETFIEMTHPSASPWESDHDSETSTPDFKRECHEVVKDVLQEQAVKEVLEVGGHYPTSRWIQKRRNRGPSVLILADAQLGNWPASDKICQVEYRPQWPVQRWIQAVKTGDIRIKAFTVVLYLEELKKWQDLPPIKNTIQKLCLAIRHFGQEPRIFVANFLPRVSSSPVMVPLVVSNFTLQQSIRSACRAVGRIHEMAMYEHFTSKNGHMLKPTHKYFSMDGLTQQGCLIFRECLLREAGLKTYWFAGPRARTLPTSTE